MDFEHLTDLLGFLPTETYKWNGLSGEEPLDGWYYRVKIESSQQLESASKDFFELVLAVSRELENDNKYKPEIVICVHSNMAQMYFDLPESIVQSLGKSNIPIAFSILSWGMVAD